MMEYVEYREHKILRYLDSLRNGWRQFPPSLQIGLTDYCFNKCIMCGHWKRKSKHRLDLESLISFLSHGKILGLETVCYSGGDPFMYGEDLNTLMRWHIDVGIKFGFITAGYVPDDIDINLVSKAEWVRCSLDSVDPDIYQVSRGGISCRKVMDSIEMMVKEHVNVGFGITIHDKNKLGIKGVFDYAMSLGIKEVRAWIVRNVSSMKPTENSYLVRHLKEYNYRFVDAGISNNLDTAVSVLGTGEEQLKFDKCYACLFQLFVDARGDIYPCCITAGDTEDSPNCSPIGSIDIPWRETKLGLYIFSDVTYDKLPGICRKNCILRLSSINHVAGKYWKEQNFI